MYKLIISELAHDDLDGIVSYIAVELANPIAAANFVKEVERCYGYLKDTPYMYELCRDPHLKKEDYRRATINNYVLIYKVVETTKTVNIHRIFYGGHDYIKLI